MIKTPIIARFLDKTNVKKLSNDQKEVLDKKLTRSELYQALKMFQRNKTPENDGLTVEFYLRFPKFRSQTWATFYLPKTGNDYFVRKER